MRYLMLILALGDPLQETLDEARAAIVARQALSWQMPEKRPPKPPPNHDGEYPYAAKPLPKGAVEYHSDGYTQEIAVTNGYDRITAVPIRNMEAKWHGSGGLVGLKGWKSRKYRLIPEGKQVQTWIGTIQVKNSSGYFQPNRGILRRYPDGTEFHDILSNDRGEVFEHRLRKKVGGKWESSIEYHNEAARPKGYTGLKVSCASCHNEAGTGGYAVGLVPGGDGVLSDPLDWSLVRHSP